MKRYLCVPVFVFASLACLIGSYLSADEEDPEAVSGGGVVLSENLHPLTAAEVRVVNDPPEEGSYVTTTDRDGRFGFQDWELTQWVDIAISSGPFYRAAEIQIPRESLESGDFKILLAPLRVDITGRVELLEGEIPEPVPGAELFAVWQGSTESDLEKLFLGSADADGNLDVDGAPLGYFGDPHNGLLEVRLPDRLAFFGEFAEGDRVERRVDLAVGIVELGTVLFHRRPPPDEVRLSGSLYVRDSIDPDKFKLIDGLVITAVADEDDEVVALATTARGEWSMTLPPGTYRFESPNAKLLGFMAVESVARPILASREGISNGLDRFVPSGVAIERTALSFVYPTIPDLDVEEVVLRIDGRLEEGLSPERETGDRYTVRPRSPLLPGAAVEVAVRIDGLLTSFSPSQAVPEVVP